MSNHTINSWKKYCLYRKDAIEDLRNKAISNAEKKAASKDKDAMDVTETEASETRPAAEQVGPQRATPQQATVQQAISRQVTPQQDIPQQPVPQQPIPQQAIPNQVVSQQSVPQQATHQQAAPQKIISPHDNQPPPPPYEKVANPGPAVVVKSEPLDEDQLDFAFAVDMLSGWNANEESDAALWRRMENLVRTLVFPWVFLD